MTATLFIVLSLCGGLGACARYALDGLVASRLAGSMPWGTILINLSGSFLLGLLAGLAAGNLLPAAWQLAVGTGFLGGYTTFSTASVETVRLLQARKPVASAANAFGTLLGALSAAGLGLWAAAWLCS
ncbi:fluoride efflux transporter CrcB [Arthrobacter sp. AG1021]|uniref:fluoride efflux transporter CrcB n=1 Tax=Arthrobacter sp. AG1021 TaxID=2183908 RepID=UPI0006B25036|nr:fluoride efflux transporter CrcB [Arthrobacter sp. AG1021]ALD63524.1 chromosome condensation protein CrcB [Arthrobacter sp. LS16]RKS19314.1 camphor resistance protein CrcB [Arthrobacter sp. AG1021]